MKDKPEKTSTMLENNPDAAAAALLLANYSFDLGGYRASELVERWLTHYPANWVFLAVIEALYQGRYKAVSVEQILTIWLRRNKVLYHVKYEFERLVCSKLPAELQAQFSTRPSNVAEMWQEDLSNPVDISSCCDQPEQLETAAISTPFEKLVQPIAQEQIRSSSIALAEVKQTHSNKPHNAVEIGSVSPPSNLSAYQHHSNHSDQSSQNFASIQFSTFVPWGFSHPPIDQFLPAPVVSDFYKKLKAFVYLSVPAEIKEPDLPNFKSRGSGEPLEKDEG